MNERFQFFDIYLNIEAALAHKNTHTVLMHRMAVIQCGDSIRAKSSFFLLGCVRASRVISSVSGENVWKETENETFEILLALKIVSSFTSSRFNTTVPNVVYVCCVSRTNSDFIGIGFDSFCWAELCSVLCSSWENPSMNKMLVIHQLCWGCTEIVVNFYPNFRKFI